MTPSAAPAKASPLAEAGAGPAARPLGLFAGGGDFPRHVLAALRKAGHEVCVVGFRGETDPRLLRSVPRSWCGTVGEYAKMIEFLRAAGVREALMAGYVKHTHIYRKTRTDSLTARIMGSLLDRRADTLLAAAAMRLKAAGIVLVSAMPYLRHLVPDRGVLGERQPSAADWKDIEFGRRMAQRIAGLDIGQTVCVRDLAVVAVEALEGTDEAVLRAGKVARGGIVVVKVAKPQQDFRFDVPVVGPRTLETLRRARARAMAVEAGRTIVLDRPEVVRRADAAGIAIVAV